MLINDTLPSTPCYVCFKISCEREVLEKRKKNDQLSYSQQSKKMEKLDIRRF